MICVTNLHYMMVMCCVFLQNGWTALHTAALNGHVDVVKLLVSYHPSLITMTDKVSK